MVGGLGSAVLEHYNAMGAYSLKIITHGIGPKFVETGDYPFMLRSARLDADGIASFVCEKLGISGGAE
jgi:transketolase